MDTNENAPRVYDLILPYMKRIINYSEHENGDFAAFVIGHMKNAIAVREEKEVIPTFVEDDKDLKMYKSVQEMITASYMIRVIVTTMHGSYKLSDLHKLISELILFGIERGWNVNNFVEMVIKVVRGRHQGFALTFDSPLMVKTTSAIDHN